MFKRQRVPQIVGVLLALLLIATVPWLAFIGIRTVWRSLVRVDPTLAVAVIAGASTVVGTTITVMLGRYFERKREIEAHFRDQKIKIYDAFLLELFKAFGAGQTNQDELVPAFHEA